MIEISLEKERIIKSLKELEKEYNKGNIPKSHYDFQKRKLTEQLEAFNVADRVRKLQGKETTDVTNEETSSEDENGELFKKFITPPGLKEKNIKPNGRSVSTKIGIGVLVAAFFIGIVFGIYGFIPQQVSSSSLYTNDTAFPPFANNSTNVTNMTNSTNTTKNITKTTNTTKTTNKTTTKKNSTNTKKNSTKTTDDDINDIINYYGY
ncbi:MULTISPECIES: hypothetical protein [Methanobacterium]|jgi:hypothetical protein|uniref:Uncharacterized protein n=1 Tax=Methanobacterium veterum TaxID=408577 RepID=A0A9E4ZVT3_9EURY|nr:MULTISPECIES: hypothetical protein [Methanobacterium]MCZ3366031.1 hypothetical protein [Methanobacterium veterum]MCZ3371496.1 hypothetical protein [Methanobacterium veterum]